MNRSQSPPVELEELTIGEVRRALAQGAAEETLREALARLEEGDELGRRHEQAQENYRRYLEARAQHRVAATEDAMAGVDRQQQSTAWDWPSPEIRFEARRAAGLQAEEEFDLAEPLLAFEDWVEDEAPAR